MPHPVSPPPWSGTGGYGESGDGGLASNATIARPHALAVDSGGNLYFGDAATTTGTFRHVRRVDAATGIITRVLGNNSSYFCGEAVPARFACFMQAYGLDVDASQNVVVTDVGDQRVRQIDESTNQVTTLASTPNFSPIGIEHDAAGNLYFPSFGLYQVHRLDRNTGVVTKVAGHGAYGFSGDGGTAVNATLASPVDVALERRQSIHRRHREQPRAQGGCDQ